MTKSRCAVTICRNGIIRLDPRFGGGEVFCGSCEAGRALKAAQIQGVRA